MRSEEINDKFRIEDQLEQKTLEEDLGMQGFFFDEEDMIQEDIMEDSVFERQMALREFSKEIEKTDEFLKRSSGKKHLKYIIISIET